MDPLPDDLRRELDALSTKADKIRTLNARGYARADIARFLEIRYQQVRNVLEQDKTKQAGMSEGGQASYGDEANPPGNIDAVALRVDNHGRLTIPPDMRAAMLLGDNRHVIAEVIDGDLRVVGQDRALLRAQEIAEKYKRPGVSVVDEFLRERRAMWGEE